MMTGSPPMMTSVSFQQRTKAMTRPATRVTMFCTQGQRR